MPIVLWQALAFPGCERASLVETRGGWELAGTIVGAIGGSPLEARYLVVCDARWRTRSTEIELRQTSVVRAAQWSIDETARWWRAGEQAKALVGCVDVDLDASPSTNTLPIRRLGLRVGESTEIVVARVSLSELIAEPARRRYTRVGETTYRFESGDFSADIEVDADGLVTHYPGAWDRVSTS